MQLCIIYCKLDPIDFYVTIISLGVGIIYICFPIYVGRSSDGLFVLMGPDLDTFKKWVHSRAKKYALLTWEKTLYTPSFSHHTSDKTKTVLGRSRLKV